MIQRAQPAIEAELSAIGIRKVDMDFDLLVALHGATGENGPLQRWRYWPRSGADPIGVQPALAGTLAVDLIDARDNRGETYAADSVRGRSPRR